MKTIRIYFAFFFFILIFSQTVFSWSNRKTLKELVNSAPLIVFGTVLEINPQIENYLGHDDFIITYVKFFVHTFFKGSNSIQILCIKIPGGHIGDRTITGERSFNLKNNEEALLFLNPIDDNYYGIYSISGKLSVEKKEDGNYVDCSLLQEDEISKYGPRSTFKFVDIQNRINGYLEKREGE